MKTHQLIAVLHSKCRINLPHEPVFTLDVLGKGYPVFPADLQNVLDLLPEQPKAKRLTVTFRSTNKLSEEAVQIIEVAETAARSAKHFKRAMARSRV